MINIGERLKYIRETYDVSQKELASILGVSHYCISHYERNDYIIPMRKLCAVSNYFQLSIDYILGFTSLKKYEDMKYQVELKTVGKRISEICGEQSLSNVGLAKILNTTGKTLLLTAFALELHQKYSYSVDWIVGKTQHKYVQEKSKRLVR